MERTAGVLPARSRAEIIFIIAGLCVALFLRLAYIYGIPHAPIRLDAAGYDRAARNILIHHTFSYFYPRPTAFTTPGYPLFLSGIYAVFGKGNLQVVRVIQAILSVVMLFFIYEMTRRLFGKFAASLAFIVAIFYPPFLWANREILTESLFVFLCSVFLFSYLKAFDTNRRGWYGICGIVLGCASLVRPTLALFPGLLFIFELLSRKRRARPLKGILLNYVWFGVAFLICLSPWIVRNYIQFKRFVPFASESGHPFIQGTYENYRLPPDLDLYKVAKGEFALNKEWWRLGKKHFWEEIRKRPVTYTHWYLSKFHHLWRSPYIDAEAFYWKDKKCIYAFHFITLWLGAVGLFFSFGRWRSSGWLILYTPHVALLQMAFKCNPRYGFVAMPVVIMFAGFGLVRLVEGAEILFKRKPRLMTKFLPQIGGVLFIYCLFRLCSTGNLVAMGLGPIFARFFPKLFLLSFLVQGIYFSLWLWKKHIITPRYQALFPICVVVAGVMMARNDYDVIRALSPRVSFKTDLHWAGDTVRQELDVPSWDGQYRQKTVYVKLCYPSGEKLKFPVVIRLNGKIIGRLKPGIIVPFDIYTFPILDGILKGAKRITLEVKMESPSPTRPLHVYGIRALYRGVSKYNGVEGDLSSDPEIQSGSFCLGILYPKQGWLPRIYWNGSPRSKINHLILRKKINLK